MLLKDLWRNRLYLYARCHPCVHDWHILRAEKCKPKVNVDPGNVANIWQY